MKLRFQVSIPDFRLLQESKVGESISNAIQTESHSSVSTSNLSTSSSPAVTSPPLSQVTDDHSGSMTFGSQKQAAAGAGNTGFNQDGNAGSINNQGVVNNQKTEVGDRGRASSFQANDQSQTSDTNPVLPTYTVDSTVTTTAYTNGFGSSFPFAGLGTTGQAFVSTEGGLLPIGGGLVNIGG